MSNIRITPSALNGEVTAPPSKSLAHRALICGGLSKGKSVITNIAYSKDIQATINCLKALGADVTINGDTVVIDGTNTFTKSDAIMECNESGSTLRFFIPIASVSGANITFNGEGRLLHRPLDAYFDLLPKHGVNINQGDDFKINISGRLTSGEFSLSHEVSSQYVTGLLFSLPLLDGDSTIKLTSSCKNNGYINMTLDVMRLFGIEIDCLEKGFFIKGNQKYKPQNYHVQGDWSQAAFFICGGALSGDITVKDIDISSSQEDKTCVEIVKRFGATVTQHENSVNIKCNKLIATDIDAFEIPDLVPILATVASFAKGKSTIYNAQRLRFKESDRLQAISEGLNNLGADVLVTDDGLEIIGKDYLDGGVAEGFNDHRIVMALSIAATRCKSDVTITDKESIQKTYPNFFEHFNNLGGVSKNL